MPVQDTAETTAETIADAAPESQVDRRLLIDGRLVTTDTTFPSINPATGAVIGHAPDAGAEQPKRPSRPPGVRSTRPSWSTDVELRIRCLDQLHRALVDHADELRELTIAEVGATRALHARALSSTTRSRSCATTPTC